MFYNLNQDEREKYILNLIYDLNKYQEIKKKEKPDFELKKFDCDFSFGIEITEFYFSGSNARLKNIPTYLKEIMLNQKYRHKDDKEKLEVKELTVQSQNKSDRKIEGIIQELTKPEEYISLISNLIKNKNEKFLQYSKKLNHINLIIFDIENRLFDISKKDFYYYYFKDNLIKSIIESKFREIYLITTVERNIRMYFPLKLIFLLSELYLLNGFLVKNKEEVDDFKGLNDLEIFAEHLSVKGVKDNIYILYNNKDTELIYGNYGVIITKKKSINVHDYNDYKIPNLAKIYEKNHGLFNKNTLREFGYFCKNYNFSTEIGFETRK